jgi:type IV secretory pathway TrbF-like protein
MGLFSSKSGKKPKSIGAGDIRLQSNTPTSPYEDGANKFAEIYGSAMVNSGRLFVISVVSLMLAITAVGAVMVLTPLKEVIPYVIEVNAGSGLVNKPIEVQKITPNIAVVKAELARWAEAVYTIDPLRTNDLFKYANVRARGKAIAQFSEFRSREQVFSRLQREAGLVREVKVSSGDASQTGVAFIFLQTLERTGNQSVEDSKVKRYRLTIHYQLDSPREEALLLANPLGLYVNFFNEAEERAN